jgi:hypothetical protein
MASAGQFFAQALQLKHLEGLIPNLENRAVKLNNTPHGHKYLCHAFSLIKNVVSRPRGIIINGNGNFLP